MILWTIPSFVRVGLGLTRAPHNQSLVGHQMPAARRSCSRSSKRQLCIVTPFDCSIGPSRWNCSCWCWVPLVVCGVSLQSMLLVLLMVLVAAAAGGHLPIVSLFGHLASSKRSQSYGAYPLCDLCPRITVVFLIRSRTNYDIGYNSYC